MPIYDFTRLSSADFEELVCDLLQAEWKTTLETFAAGRDSGIDLRAYSNSPKTTIVQCKHYAKSGFTQLIHHIRTSELAKIKKLKPRRYVLATSLGLTPNNKDQLLEILKPYVKRTGDILGADEINSMLGKHSFVETKNFKLWLTSTAVMQRVLHNAEHFQTEFELDRVIDRLPIFVQNKAYPRAQRILSKGRIVVISGVPGIGKTTLAELLLYAHLQKRYRPIVIQGSLTEAKKQFDKNEKRIFYFDDFLGQTLLRDNAGFLARNQDAALVDFIEAVKRTKTSRFILTTREHILQNALQISERMERSSILSHRCILELSDYTYSQKAQILYNHLYFSDLPILYKQALLENKFFMRIIRHRNFNPRIIEWLSGYSRVRKVDPSEFCTYVEELLDNPHQIWRHAFEKQISHASRSLILALHTCEYGASLDKVELMWRPLQYHRAKKYGFELTSHDFRDALKELEGSFISIDAQRLRLTI